MCRVVKSGREADGYGSGWLKDHLSLESCEDLEEWLRCSDCPFSASFLSTQTTMLS